MNEGFYTGENNEISTEKAEDLKKRLDLLKSLSESFNELDDEDRKEFISGIVTLAWNAYTLGYYAITRECFDIIPDNYKAVDENIGKERNIKVYVAETVLGRIGVEILPQILEKTQKRADVRGKPTLGGDTDSVLQEYRDAAKNVRESELFVLLRHSLSVVMNSEVLLQEAKKKPAVWFEKVRALSELSVRIGCDNETLSFLLKAAQTFNPNGEQSTLPLLSIVHGIAGIDDKRRGGKEDTQAFVYDLFAEPLTGANPKQALDFLNDNVLTTKHGSVIHKDIAYAYYVIVVTRFSAEELYGYGVTADDVFNAKERAQNMLTNTSERDKMDEVHKALVELEYQTFPQAA